MGTPNGGHSEGGRLCTFRNRSRLRLRISRKSIKSCNALRWRGSGCSIPPLLTFFESNLALAFSAISGTKSTRKNDRGSAGTCGRFCTMPQPTPWGSWVPRVPTCWDDSTVLWNFREIMREWEKPPDRPASHFGSNECFHSSLTERFSQIGLGGVQDIELQDSEQEQPKRLLLRPLRI